MSKLFTLKTVFTSSIVTGLAASLMTLPVKAHENSLLTNNQELITSQNWNYGDRYNNEPTDDFKLIVGLIGLTIGTGVIGYHVTRAYKPSWVSSLPTVNNKTDNNRASLLDRINPRLRRELLRLVHNRATASRLLAGTSFSHPNRSANWVAEKVIYDLKRDR